MTFKEVVKNYSGISRNYHKLTEGQEIKNYNQLCNILDIPIKSGNNRKNQIKDFDRYFEYERQGHKYIITCVYDEPLTKYSRSVLANYIESLVLNMLVDKYRQGENYILLSKNQIYQALALTNNNYIKHTPQRDKLNSNSVMDILEVNQNDLEYFYTNTNSKFKGMLATALKDLENKFIVKYTEPTIMCVGWHESQYSKVIEANTEETNLITKHEEIVSKEMGYTSYDDIRKRNLTHILRNEVTDRYNQYIIDTGITFIATASTYYDYMEYYYKGYKIMFTDSIINESDRMNRYVLDNKEEIERLLNSKIVNKLKDSYIKISDKHKLMLSSGEYDNVHTVNDMYKKDRSLHKASNEFVTNGHKLVDYNIKK